MDSGSNGYVQCPQVDRAYVFQATTQPGWPWWSIKDKTFTKFDGGDAPFEVSSLKQVARAVTAILRPENIDATKNTYVFVHSCTLTQNQLLKIFEDFTGKKWSVSSNRVKDINAAGKETFFQLTKDKPLEELGNIPDFAIAIVMMISSGCFGLGGVNSFADKAKYWMDKLGLEAEDPVSILRGALPEYAAQA